MLPSFPLDFYQLLIVLRRFFLSSYYCGVAHCHRAMWWESRIVVHHSKTQKRWEKICRPAADVIANIGTKKQDRLGMNDVGIINAWLTQHSRYSRCKYIRSLDCLIRLFESSLPRLPKFFVCGNAGEKPKSSWFFSGPYSIRMLFMFFIWLKINQHTRGNFCGTVDAAMRICPHNS
jgi:hypothetical protein